MPDNLGTQRVLDDRLEKQGTTTRQDGLTPSLAEMFRRLLKAERQSRTARTVEYFGWLDLTLGILILAVPGFMAWLLRVPMTNQQSENYLRLIGLLVSALGMLYVVTGRLNTQGFSFASLLDRPLVPVIMAVLWRKNILPGGMALAFSISDFGGFLWTLSAWRAETRPGLGDERSLSRSLREMFRRLFNAEGQSRAARTVEYFGWISMVLGTIILLAPGFTAWLLNLPTLIDQSQNALMNLPQFTSQSEDYFRLVGLLVGGLGMLYVVSGRLNALGFIFATLLDRPLAPVIMTVLWYHDIVPETLALAFAVICLGGFLWTRSAWRADVANPRVELPRPGTRIAAWFFGFVSGVVRNARTFHPDGRVVRGTVESLRPADPSLASAAEQLAGTVLIRMGMGVMKRGMPGWLADRLPDAPSIAMRLSPPGEVRLERCPGEDLDLLCTAGGDRLWKLLVNLMLGGKMFGLHQFDYFNNLYYSQVPYRIDNGNTDVWVRLVPDRGKELSAPALPQNGPAREQDLTNAIACHGGIAIEVQQVDGESTLFVPIARVRFEEEINIDQEALHFSPVAGRGFEPHGFFTEVRKIVYPVSTHSRPSSAQERVQRENQNRFIRMGRFLEEREGLPAEEPIPGGRRWRAWLKFAGALAGLVFVVFAIYMATRLASDYPVAVHMQPKWGYHYPTDYPQPPDAPNDAMHFMYGSTGGERTDGLPYWFWVALPEIFADELPDKKSGQGYKSFGMIYEDGKDPKYDLPVGVSMRHFRGLDVVYLNCAACHTGTYRDYDGGPVHVVPGMPANTFNLGAWGKFLTSIVKEERFTPQRMMDQIDKMQDDLHRVVDKPDLINRLIFKYYAVALMRQQLITLGDRLSFINTDTWGPGRVDTFNAPKALLNFPMKKYADPDELVGNSDFPSVWNQAPRRGMQLHWDGNNLSVDERNLSAAFGTGAYPPTLDTPRVLRTASYLKTATPPPFPKEHIDSVLVEQGKPLYQKYCAQCHGQRDPPFRREKLNSAADRGNCRHLDDKQEELVGTVECYQDIGTDRARMDSYTWLLTVNQSTLYASYENDWGFAPEYPERFHNFVKQPGYANAPLDGIWLRAPYLHNGSVPNLWELLTPAEKRVQIFCRGNDVYDYRNVGFVAEMKDGCKFFVFNTSQPGNGKNGHSGERFGTDLFPQEKWALIEYLKTF